MQVLCACDYSHTECNMTGANEHASSSPESVGYSRAGESAEQTAHSIHGKDETSGMANGASVEIALIVGHRVDGSHQGTIVSITYFTAAEQEQISDLRTLIQGELSD